MKTLSAKGRRELEDCYSKVEWYINRLAAYISPMCRVPFEDLKQEGFIGVSRAKELYNEELASFLTYAQYWIKMCMFSLAYKSMYALNVPEEFHVIYSKYTRELKARRGTNKESSIRAVSKAIGVTENRLAKIVKTIKALKSSCSLEDVDPKGECGCPSEILITDRSSEILRHLRECATPEEVFVVDHMLGLTTHSQKTLSWVGNILGVTKERVRQIKKSALQKLEKRLTEVGWHEQE